MPLVCHEIDQRILKAIVASRGGATAKEVFEYIARNYPEPTKRSVVKTHLRSMTGIGLLCRTPTERDGKPIYCWKISLSISGVEKTPVAK